MYTILNSASNFVDSTGCSISKVVAHACVFSDKAVDLVVINITHLRFSPYIGIEFFFLFKKNLCIFFRRYVSIYLGV